MGLENKDFCGASVMIKALFETDCGTIHPLVISLHTETDIESPQQILILIFPGTEGYGHSYVDWFVVLSYYRCVNDVKSGVGKLLSFVNTVKRLADIRDAVWQIQSQVSLILYKTLAGSARVQGEVHTKPCSPITMHHLNVFWLG